MDFLLNAALGAATGVITGFGIGGGTLLILFLTMFRGFSQISAQGINLFYFLPTAGSALVAHIKNRLIIWRAVLFAGSSGVLSTIISAIAAGRLDVELLRRFFGGFLIVVGVSELFRKNGKRGQRKDCDSA